MGTYTYQLIAVFIGSVYRSYRSGPDLSGERWRAAVPEIPIENGDRSYAWSGPFTSTYGPLYGKIERGDPEICAREYLLDISCIYVYTLDLLRVTIYDHASRALVFCWCHVMFGSVRVLC